MASACAIRTDSDFVFVNLCGIFVFQTADEHLNYERPVVQRLADGKETILLHCIFDSASLELSDHPLLYYPYANWPHV